MNIFNNLEPINTFQKIQLGLTESFSHRRKHKQPIQLIALNLTQLHQSPVKK